MQQCRSFSELSELCQGMSKKTDIVVNGDEFASHGGKNDDTNGQSAWTVFSEAFVFDPVFEVRMIFTDKKVMNTAIKSRTIVDQRNAKLTKNDYWKRVFAKYVEKECR